MAAKTKIELILELKNKIKSGLSDARTKINHEVGYMKVKLAELKHSFNSNLKDIGNEIPWIGTAARLIQNPIVLASAAVAGLYKGFSKATQEAANFNTQFRQLSSLNLDKTKDEINSLKQTVLDTAFAKGFDTEKTTMGFFDVQSTTGKFGREVRKIVEKQGEFARLMQADFNNYIAGTAKAMANFGFGAEKLDEFNKSSYATMKVGVTTFDQLAKVQSVYSGAAAAAKQGFDAANKMFALFSIRTKSVDEAATLTKSMFNDLTKAATIDAFKKVGIDVYDASGKLKQADNLLLELNKKFRSMDSDRKIVELKNQFSGSEGLIALVQAATDQSGQLQATFSGFDDTEFGMNKALKEAKEDLNYINEELKNKTNVALIELGEALLPINNFFANFKLVAIEKLAMLLGGEKGRRRMGYNDGRSRAEDMHGKSLQNVKNYTKDEMQKEVDFFTTAIEPSIIQSKRNTSGGNAPEYFNEYWQAHLDYVKKLKTDIPHAWAEAQWGSSISNWKDVSLVTANKAEYPTEMKGVYHMGNKNDPGGLKWSYNKGKQASAADLDYLKTNVASITQEQFQIIFANMVKASQDAIAEYKAKKGSDPNYAEYMRGWADFRGEFMADFRDLWGKATNYGTNVTTTINNSTTNNTSNSTVSNSTINNETANGGGNLSNSVTAVTGSAKQIRNITVRIDAINKGGINTQNTTLQKMDTKQIEEWFIDTCMRAVRNIEMSY